MNHLFVLCNQHDQFFTKSGEWNTGEDNRALFRTPHKDEAINQMVEISVKHPDQRLKIVKVTQDERGLLQLPAGTPPKTDPPAALPVTATTLTADTASEDETMNEVTQQALA